MQGGGWDAARGAFYPDFDHGGGATPAAALKSSLYPNAPLVFLMSTPEVRLAVAPFVVHPLPGSGVPLHHHAFSGDPIDGNPPVIIRWTEECFGPVKAQALDAANVLAAWTADVMAARLGPMAHPDGKLAQTRRVFPSLHRCVVAALAAQCNGTLDWHWL